MLLDILTLIKGTCKKGKIIVLHTISMRTCLRENYWFKSKVDYTYYFWRNVHWIFSISYRYIFPFYIRINYFSTSLCGLIFFSYSIFDKKKDASKPPSFIFVHQRSTLCLILQFSLCAKYADKLNQGVVFSWVTLHLTFDIVEQNNIRRYRFDLDYFLMRIKKCIIYIKTK